MFKQVDPKSLDFNVFSAIGEQWMLITAGTEAGYNTMTASWGHIGSIWGRRSFGLGTSVCYVRPQRYTKEFIDREEYYTLTGEHTLITVTAQMQEVDDLSGITRKLGDVMFDFTVTDTDGTTYKLSEMLKEKQAAVETTWLLTVDASDKIRFYRKEK